MDPTSAATDVAEFISDLDAGQFERMLSVALSQTAAKCVDLSKKGKVTIELEIEPIANTHQVSIAHTLKFTTPTTSGKTTEESTRVTVMHVGRYGAVSLATPDLFPKAQQQTLPTT